MEQGEEVVTKSEAPEIIGKGTWLDRVAKEIIERERKLGRSLSKIRVESGLGASGIPHIGSLGDAARAYGVKLALEEAGYSSELIAYSDDMDALRKVPAGLPEWLANEIAKPVSKIRDPFGCHASYGAHMSFLLMDGLDKLGLEYLFQSGYEAYREGLLVKQIDMILRNSDKIGEKIEELTGQEKFKETLPYFPLCSNCGRLNVAHAKRYDPNEMKVYYKCSGDVIGRRHVDGCGNNGAASILKGEGKLSWKVEFAARWAAFDIRYEAHGKELIDSVRINDWVSENVLNFPPPYHVVYELFQDKSGKKISKSLGNLVSPQKWLSLASRQSLMLLYFKRIVGARNISEEDIPTYMDEYDALEDLYFGKVKESNKLKEAREKGLYYYVNLSHPPVSPPQHVPYRLLVELAHVAPPPDPEEYIAKRLVDYRSAKDVDSTLREKIRFALNWAKEFALPKQRAEVSPREREALLEISEKIRGIKDPELIQATIFQTARSLKMEPPELFRILYGVLIGSDRGPRLGPYIFDVGTERISNKLKDAVK